MPDIKPQKENNTVPQRNKLNNTKKSTEQTAKKAAENIAPKTQKQNRPKNNLPAVKKEHKRHNFPVRRFNQKPQKQSLAEKLTKTFTSLIGKGIKTILPWIFLSMLLYGAGTYYVFHNCFIGHNYPLWYLIICAVILFTAFIGFGLVYGLAMGLLYTVKAFSQSFGGIIRETINRFKNSLESKIDKAADSLSKNEAAKIVRQTFDNLSADIRKYAAKTAAGVAALSVLGVLVFLCRKFLLKSFAAIKNKADFFAVMSARTALVAAIILNLTLFTKIAIAAGYLIGIAVFALQGFTVLILK